MKSVRFSLPGGSPPDPGQSSTLSLLGLRRGNKRKAKQAPTRRRKGPHENDKDDVIRTRDVSGDSSEEEEDIRQPDTFSITTTRASKRPAIIPQSRSSGRTMPGRLLNPELTDMSDSELALLDPQTRTRSAASDRVNGRTDDPDYALYTAALTTSSDVHPSEEWNRNTPVETASNSATAADAATIAAAMSAAESAEIDQNESADNAEMANGIHIVRNNRQFTTPPPSSPQGPISPGDTTVSILSREREAEEQSRPATPLLPLPWGRDSAHYSPLEANPISTTPAPAPVTRLPLPPPIQQMLQIPAQAYHTLQTENLVLRGQTSALIEQNTAFLRLRDAAATVATAADQHSTFVPRIEYQRVVAENAQLRAQMAQHQYDMVFLRECCREWETRDRVAGEEIGMLREEVDELLARLRRLE